MFVLTLQLERSALKIIDKIREAFTMRRNLPKTFSVLKF